LKRYVVITIVAAMHGGGGCTPAEPAMIRASAPAGPLAVGTPADGWATIREPGWFHAEFPGPPRASFEWDKTHQGKYRYKNLVAQAGGALLTVHYVEYLDPKDLEEARTTIHERFVRPLPNGIHVVSTAPATLGSASGEQMLARVDPSSETNAAAIPLDERVVFVAKQGRVFQIQCAAPKQTYATCERFFASFEIE
jgi:hypothetical protein